jgi:hypothetical protein
MIPNQKWFPSSLQERAAWFVNFKANIQGVGLTLGMTVGEITSVGEDSDILDFLATTSVAVDAYIDGIRNYRKIISEGGIGDPTPAFPSDVSFSLPTPIDTGLFERLDNLVKRIRVAPAYTDEIGALLGITTNGGGPHIPIGEVPPVITASVDPGNIVEVKFTRGASNGVYIETNIDNGGWAFAEKAVKSPAVFDVEANPANTPRGVQIRARFLEGNNPTGDWSDIATVQTIP